MARASGMARFCFPCYVLCKCLHGLRRLLTWACSGMKSSSELEGFREQCSAEPTVNFLEGCAKPVLRLWCRAIVAEGYTPPAVPAIVSVVAQSNQLGDMVPRFHLQFRLKCQTLRKQHNLRLRDPLRISRPLTLSLSEAVSCLYQRPATTSAYDYEKL